MKKLYILASLLIGAVSFSSCVEKELTTLQDPTEFVLNEPAYKNTLYDLENSTALELTCSQPNYGFTAGTTYAVEVSMAGTFTSAYDEKDNPSGDYVVLGTKSTSAKIMMDAAELAAALTVLSGKEESEFPIISEVYVRVKASLTTSGKGEIVSNTIVLPNVRVHFALPAVALPEKMLMNGGMFSSDWNWGSAREMVPVHSHPELFWAMVYCPADGEFKFNKEADWDGGEFGYAGATVIDNAQAGVSDNGNFKISKAGWYLFVVKTELEGRNYKYTVEVNAPNVYAIGNTSPTASWDIKDENLYTVPADAEGAFVSPALARDFAGDDTDGCFRACIKLEGVEWWQTEFVALNGELAYRGTGNDQTRVGGKAGQSMYLYFTTGKAEIK